MPGRPGWQRKGFWEAGPLGPLWGAENCGTEDTWVPQGSKGLWELARLGSMVGL